ncbi:hypothetical protein H6F60_14175 [Coleofasciculus sp. FACHB-129]|nr:hypothetical protein [Coleofasciculus sp. FACHB-129]
MFRNGLVKLLLCLTLTITLILGATIPALGKISPAYAADVLTKRGESYSKLTSIDSSTNWSQLDQYLLNAVRSAHDSTEEFAASELDDWVNDLMKKVDDKFLNWYFSYINQKGMEFGIPFAWLAFGGDYSLNFFRKETEKKLNPNQALQQKMIEDFQNKFSELVLSPEQAQESLEKLAVRVGRNYASALGMKLATIKNTYKIPDGDWERYLNDLATVAYETGNSKSSLSPESLTSNLTTDLLIFTTAGIGGKVALNFAAKAAAKIAAKAGGAVVAKVGAQLVDPILAVGILVWDTWDYRRMVDESRPVLHQNILSYLNEVKWSILEAPENSIMTAIEGVESKITTELELRLAS